MMRAEFDIYGNPMKEGEVIVKTNFEDYDDPESNCVSLKFDGKETQLIKADVDQWGTYYTINGVTVAQEFDTRSFLDALIKGLTKFRETFESTLEATIIQEDNETEGT